jgi:hypothetical protein
MCTSLFSHLKCNILFHALSRSTYPRLKLTCDPGFGGGLKQASHKFSNCARKTAPFMIYCFQLRPMLLLALVVGQTMPGENNF